MPSAAIMPWMSSGDVSGRTRITCFARERGAPRRRRAVKYTLPTAAPGDALRPFVIASYFAVGIELRVEELVELVGRDAQHRLALVDEPLVLHVDGDPQRGRGGALAHAHLQHEQTCPARR